MSDDVGTRIRSFLSAHHVLSLATQGPDGPHASSLFYACDGFSLLWVSDTETRHSRELERDPQVAATIAPDCSDFAAVRGLQIAGHARRVVGDDATRRHLTMLEARFPFLKKLSLVPDKLRQAYARTAVYRLDPSKITLIDNSRGFGHKESVEFTY
ncbi:MAG: pyridoxamine 5'-phosphate oxidase [Xanthobacteraceae bacterium]|nr:MAG: pyridoxamine 5'-phosphate oxidase [Xanthobacteraceae bacterium]